MLRRRACASRCQARQERALGEGALRHWPDACVDQYCPVRVLRDDRRGDGGYTRVRVARRRMLLFAFQIAAAALRTA